MESFKKYFVNVVSKKYIAFEGKADRAEFWYFVLYSFIISFVLGLVFAPLAGLFNLAILLPSLSVSARRLRDAGHSPWWLLTTIFGIGVLIVIVLCALPSKNTSHTKAK